MARLGRIFKHLRDQRGFTFIEVITTSVIIGIGFTAIFETFIAANNLNRQSAQYLAASKFAQTELDYYRSQLFTTDVTATSETDSTSLLSGSTDVSGSMPSLPGGTAISCSSAASGTLGKYACVTVAAVETGMYRVTVFVGYREGGTAERTVQLSTYVAQNGVGTNPTVWNYYFDHSDAGPARSIFTQPSTWTNSSNAVDGSIATASTNSSGPSSCSVSQNGFTENGCMFIYGTNSPPQGGTGITTVKARIYGSNSTAYIYQGCTSGTSCWGTALATLTMPSGSATFGSWVTLSAPSGGWTWPILKHLVLGVNGCSTVPCSISEVQLRVFQ